jgi:hypothetical protein
VCSSDLEEFLETHGHDLVDGMFSITISGKLTFQQSLLYSKITDSKSLQKKVNQLIIDEHSFEDLSGDFVILTSELINTILTSDLIQTLQKICTPNEWKEIKKCHVVTAAFYKKSDQTASTNQWLERLQKNSKDTDYSYDLKTQNVMDIRDRSWVAIPLNNFFLPLISQRSELKKKLKEGKGNIQELSEWKGLQEMLKLICNTVYGVLASSYFDIGNTIVPFKEGNRLEISILSFSTHLYLPVKTMKLLITIRDLFFSL